MEGCARAALNTFFGWALTMGIIEHNVVIGTPQPGRAEPRSRVLSNEELVAIWRACGDDDYGRHPATDSARRTAARGRRPDLG